MVSRQIRRLHGGWIVVGVPLYIHWQAHRPRRCRVPIVNHTPARPFRQVVAVSVSSEPGW